MTEKYTIEAVECSSCGKLHRATSQDFLSIYGNICVGLGGGIVGNNFDEEGRVAKVTYVCHSKGCVNHMLFEGAPALAGGMDQEQQGWR